MNKHEATADGGGMEEELPEQGAADTIAPLSIDENASFGIEEGEVEQLERKWITWSYDVDENKRLVLDEVEDSGMTPQRLSVWDSGSPRLAGGGSRPRRRTAWGDTVVANSPVFYGWVIAALVALCALVVSPAQVYSVGVVVDLIIEDEALGRRQVSGLYATAALLSAPLILLYPILLRRLSRRLLITACGVAMCAGLLLLASSGGQVSLLLSWMMLQAVGPGMLYPLVESVLHDWWDARRARVSTLVQAASAALGMLLMPLLVHGLALSACDGRCQASECGCWRGAYTSVAALIAVPIALLSALLLEGGAVDHNLRLDGRLGGDQGEIRGRLGLLEGSIATSERAAHSEGSEGVGGAGGSAEAAGRRGGVPVGGADGADAPADLEELPDLHATGGACDGAPPAAIATPVRGRRSGSARRRYRRAYGERSMWVLADVLNHSTFWLAQVSISTVQAIVAAFLFHRQHMMAVLLAPAGGAQMMGDSKYDLPDSSGAISIEVLVGVVTIGCTPLYELTPRKEYLPLCALLLVVGGTLQLAVSYSTAGHDVAAVLMGAAYGITNAYGTSALWDYFYGGADSHRIKHVSVAITTATSGVTIWIYGAMWHSSQSYRGALVWSALVAAALGVCDALALAKPEVLEGIVRRAPTWEQMLAWRQRAGYFSALRRVRQAWAVVRAAVSAVRRGAPRPTSATEVWEESGTMEPFHQANPINPSWKEES